MKTKTKTQLLMNSSKDKEKNKKETPYLPSKAELLRIAKKIPTRYSYRDDETEAIQKQVEKLERKLCNTPEMKELRTKLSKARKNLYARVSKWNNDKKELITSIQLQGPSV